MMEKSLIREFFDGKSVFITGATGFVGKVLVEKLLRYCDGIDKIYLLIRSKKGQSVEERCKNLLNSKLFSFAIDINKVGHKVVPISGDLSLPQIGLTTSDRKLLTENVSVIIHVAGDVKFNETIRDAVTHNLIGTKLILNLCKDMHKLEALVHTSTAYAFCQKRELEEKIYPMKTTPEEVIQAVEIMDDYQLDKFVKPFLEGRPNSYTFAKALAEHIVLKERGDIPTAIVRPSVVTSSYEEPISGWIDSFNGPVGIALLGSLGIMRICDYEVDTRISFVPVDWTCNALIASAWFVATHKPKDIQIYHMASEPHNTPPIYDLVNHFSAAQSTSPSMKVVRPIAGIPTSRPSKLRLWLTILISHILFAYVVDAIIWIFRYKPIMISVTQRMHSGFEMLSYFWMHSWKFHSNNTRNLMNVLKDESPFDACNLQMDVSLVDWRQLIEKSWIGGRRYLLKETDESIPIARKRLQKMIIGYRLFLFFWYSLLAYGFYWIISGPIISILY